MPAPVHVSADRIERTPPHDLEAEVCVLGSMLLDAEVIGEIVTLVRAEDFYREAHRRMFDTMVAHSLIEPDMRHSLDYLAEASLGYTPMGLEQSMPEKGGLAGGEAEASEEASETLP